MNKNLIIEKQKELIIELTKALDFLADNNLIKGKKSSDDTNNLPFIDLVNKAAQLRKDIIVLESTSDKELKKAFAIDASQTESHC